MIEITYIPDMTKNAKAINMAIKSIMPGRKLSYSSL